MVRPLLITLFALTGLTVFSQHQLVEFTFTKPHSLLNFVETILDRQGNSQTVRSIFRESKYNTPGAREQLAKLSKIKTEYSYRFNGYPSSRYMVRNTWDLMTIASARCQTLYELKIATVGLLPNSDQHQLFETLMYFDTIYSDLIWNDNLTKLAAYATQLNDYAQNRNIDELFQKLSSFYGSSWDRDVPFKVCLYPIPAKRGNSTATPKGNIVTCGVLLDDYNFANTLGVVFHELCHLLYREQSVELQNQFESWFTQAKEPSKLLAYQLIDEAMATALGNGWIYEKITGSIDTAEWYNDYYINRFAKNSYPLIKEYVSNGKTVDKHLITSLTEVYERVFPGVVYEFNNLFSNIHIVTDLNDADAEKVFPIVFDHFRVGGAGLSTPLDANNLGDLSTHLATRVIIISKENKKTWDFLRKNLNEARNIKLPDISKNFYLVHQGSDGQNYVFINLVDPSNLELAFETMKKTGKVEAGKMIGYF